MSEEQEQDRSHDRIWYLRRGQKVHGPLSSVRMRQLVIEGQLTMEDQVSTDRRRWRALRDVPEVVPLQMRRSADDMAAEYEAQEKARRGVALPLTVIVLLLGAVVGLAVWFGNGSEDSAPDCSAAPRPGLNWNNCRLSGLQAPEAKLAGLKANNVDLRGAVLEGAEMSEADLRYSTLEGADLSYARLTGAQLKGASLRNTNLSYADLSGADLRYADFAQANLGAANLQDAQLEGAHWVDGRRCAEGSVGACR